MTRPYFDFGGTAVLGRNVSDFFPIYNLLWTDCEESGRPKIRKIIGFLFDRECFIPEVIAPDVPTATNAG